MSSDNSIMFLARLPQKTVSDKLDKRRNALFALLAACCFFACPGSASLEAAAARRAQDAGAWRSLQHMARFYGFPAVHVTEERFVCRSPYSQLIFEAGSRRLTFNGVLIYLNDAVGGPEVNWRIRVIDADTVVDALLRSRRVLPDRATRVVVLDPGHGGEDLGAVGARNVQEKRVVLDIARRVREKLRGEPFKVYLSREGDYAVSIADRVQFANDRKADLFISIHVNAARNTTVSGVETFVLPAAGYPSTARGDLFPGGGASEIGNKFDSANTLLGYLLQKELLAATAATDRGLKRARFGVLKGVNAPAALVECGFVSNPQEERKMLRAEHRDSLAEAIAEAVREFSRRNR